MVLRDDLPNLFSPVRVEGVGNVADEWFQFAVLCQVIDNPFYGVRITIFTIVRPIHRKLHTSFCHVGTNALGVTGPVVFECSCADCSKKNVPEYGGKRTLIWRLGIPNGCDDGEEITRRTDNDHCRGSRRRSRVDCKEEVCQSNEKQEKGYVNERWDEIDYDVHVPPL